MRGEVKAISNDFLLVRESAHIWHENAIQLMPKMGRQEGITNLEEGAHFFPSPARSTLNDYEIGLEKRVWKTRSIRGTDVKFVWSARLRSAQFRMTSWI